MTMSDEEKGISAGTVMVSFLAGAAFGAGLALLYAPKSGKAITIVSMRENYWRSRYDGARRITSQR